MADISDTEAMKLIRRAAILLEQRGEGCLTPGAHYETTIAGPNELSIRVRLSDEQAERLKIQMTQYPYRVPYMEQMMHDYFQVAVFKILEGNIA